MFEGFRERPEPVWVSLEASAGIGKTRVVQEFYAELAKRQPKPRYWPSSLTDDTNAAHRAVSDTDWRRKRVYPERFQRPAGATPSWFWWGISCAHRSGTEVQALTEDLLQLSVHRDFVEQTVAKDRSIGATIANKFRQSIAGATESAFGDLASAIASSIPVVGLLTFAVKKVTQAGIQKVRHSRRAASIEDIALDGTNERSIDLAADISSEVEATAKEGFPFIIYIEDFHWADSQLTEMLVRVLTVAKGSILVVTSAWPGEIDRKDLPISALLARVPAARIHRFDSDNVKPRSPFPANASLCHLSDTECRSILQHYLPNIEPATASLLAARFPNPYSLEIVSRLRHVKTAVGADGVIRMSSVQVDQMAQKTPRLKDLYRAAWNEVPNPIRLGLSLASTALPASISPDWGFREKRWDAEIFASAIEQVPAVADLLQHDATKVDRGAVACGWAINLGNHMRQFNEPDMLQIAQDYGEGDLSPAFHVRPLLVKLAEVLRGAVSADEGTRVQLHDRLLVALAAAGVCDPDNVVVQAAIDLADGIYKTSGESRELCKFAELACDWTRRLGPTGEGRLFHLLRYLCHTLLRAGHVDKAEIAIREMENLTSTQPASCSTAALLRARLLYSKESNVDALAAVDNLLADPMHESLSASDRQYLRELRCLCLKRMYRLEEARADLHKLLESEIDLLHRKAIASVDRRLGQVDVAEKTLRDVEAQQREALGMSHPDYLATVQLYGAVRRDQGCLSHAEELFERLIKQRSLVLGPEHRDTLEATSHKAWLRRHQRRLPEAEEIARSVLQQSEKSLVLDHPDTVTLRHNIAVILREQGQYDESKKLLESVLEHRTRHQGPTAWVTLASRKEKARLAAAQDKPSEAADMLQKVIEDLTAGCGRPFAVEVLDVEMLGLRAKVGGHGALADMQASVDRLTARIGRSHPKTARARGQLARTMLSHGKRLEAQRVVDLALADAMLMDRDHPLVLDLERLRDENEPTSR